MKIFRIIRKSFKDAFKSVLRNFSLSMASISCTAITLILVSVALLASYNVNSITKEIEENLIVIAFVDNSATEEEISELKTVVFELDNVNKEDSKFVSKEEIKENLSQDEDLKAVLDTLDENPLQSSFNIYVKDARFIDDTADKLKSMNKITSVKYGENLSSKLVATFDVLRNACVVAVIALIIVTAFLISNTIKIAIFSRRQEINIMRLVGTSNTVIKLPFLIEGGVIGVIGSVLPILITIYGYQFVYDFVGGKLFTDLAPLVSPNEIVFVCSLILLIVGGLVGMFGSSRAVRRYLKI